MDRDRGHTGSGVLLERGNELSQIERALGAAISGSGRGLLIQGQAGIGKTALLDVARTRARAQGMTVLAARGGELEGHFPFGVVRQLFEPYLHRAPPQVRASLLAGAAGLAGTVVGGVSEAAAGSASRPGGVEGSGVLHGLYWLAVNASVRGPLLIAVDDLQWADARSLRFLIYLLARLDGLAIAILGTLRTGESIADPGVMAQLESARMLEVITPDALSAHAVAQLVAGGLARPHESFAAACALATGGVPFLVLELVAALAADGVHPDAEQAGLVAALGPRTVARAALVRLARMPAGSLPLARAIAVLGGDVPLARAVRLAGLDEASALVALDALVRADLVFSGARLRFTHPIIRAAIYDELAPGERTVLHRRAAELLTAEGAEIDAVAAQLLASEPSGSSEVVSQLRAAASHAVARGAAEDAIAYLTRALAEGSERARQADLSLRLGMAARMAGQPALMNQHFQEAFRLAEDPRVRTRAALELATLLMFLGEWERPSALVETALSDLGDREPALTLRLRTLQTAIYASDPSLVGQLDARLPELRQLAATGTKGTRALALLLAAVAAWRGLPSGEVVELFERGWDRGRVLRDPDDRWAPWQGATALVIGEQLDRAQALVEALTAAARERGAFFDFVMASGYAGWIDSRRGRLAEAEEALRTAVEGMGRQHLNFEVRWHLWFAYDVIVERPQAADLMAVAEDDAILASSGAAHSTALMLEARGRARQVAGRTADAVSDLRAAGEIFDGLGLHNPNATSWRSALALMLGNSQREEALCLIGDELEDALRIGNPRAIGVALRARGIAIGGSDGRADLEEAVAVLKASPARLEYARALVALGSHMRRTGARSAARERLRAGLDIAVATGAERLAEHAHAELEASGARLRRERITGRDALTPSELRVANLAAEGLTNAEIAQALFVTPKTVDTHLSHAYSKLGIGTRRDLGAALEQRREEVALATHGAPG